MADIHVTFTKMGRLQYISHLDLQRAIQRMLVRSGLPIVYSEGFNPHPRLNIVLPLSIYQEGEREMFEFKIDSEVPVDEIKEKLQQSAFPEMEIVEVVYAARKPVSKTAVWRLELETDLSPEYIENALKGEMLVTKRSKKGEKLVDISPQVKFISAESAEYGAVLRVELPAANSDYLNPAYIAAFFGDKVNLLRTVRENILF